MPGRAEGIGISLGLNRPAPRPPWHSTASSHISKSRNLPAALPFFVTVVIPQAKIASHDAIPF
jgi:hypothetical protein